MDQIRGTGHERGGFILALGVSLLFTILILPVLLLIPLHIRYPREGESLGSEVVHTRSESAILPASL